MNLIDRRIDHLNNLRQRVQTTTSFHDALAMLGEQRELERALSVELDAVNRAQRGWLFIEPVKS